MSLYNGSKSGEPQVSLDERIRRACDLLKSTANRRMAPVRVAETTEVRSTTPTLWEKRT